MEKKESSGKLKPLFSILFDVFFVVFVAALMSFAVIQWKVNSLLEEDQKITIGVIDAKLLAEQAIRALTFDLSQGNITEDEMVIKSKKFSEALLEQLKVYARDGLLVIRKDAVYELPSNTPDLTEATKNKLLGLGFHFEGE